MNAQERTNRLAAESSPYLLQHAHNPVDWYPWGEEAFARAKAEDKPILLSVGYSACHWCHVMERESFESEEIAAQMNRDFVCVKVDREERPDVDAIYMAAVQILTGQGGWPMTVFLTPQGEPFYGGTYYPPEDRWGRPGFPRILTAVAEAWRDRRQDAIAQAAQLAENVAASSDVMGGMPDALLNLRILDAAYEALARQFDRRYGGFGDAPKFPQPANLDFLLRYAARTNRQQPLQMVVATLGRMAEGGIFDQLGGGFHRYSTDAQWLAPHFEKMLYDNAQLAQTYARGFQATGEPLFREIAERTLDYVLREMTSDEGGFYSAQDADSEGEEGKFFVWTPAEVAAILGEPAAALFAARYDISERGNWEGKSILRVMATPEELSAKFGMPTDDVERTLRESRERLFAARERRPHPALDDKVLTAWNGLMLAAFAECAAVFDDARLLAAAVRNAEFVLAKLAYRDEAGRLRLNRAYRSGAARVAGYLEDYSFYADGLLRLYEATFDPRWLRTARELIDTTIACFWDEEGGGFFTTSVDGEELIHRPKDWDDNATPSGNSVAVEVMFKLALLTGEADYRDRAARTLRRTGSVLERHPYGFARILGALDFYLAKPKEVAIIGPPEEPETRALIRAVHARYVPNRVVAGAAGSAAPPDIPLLADRPMQGGRPTAYVCEDFVCRAPVTEPAALMEQLRDGSLGP